MTELKLILDNSIIEKIETNEQYLKNEKYNIDYFSIRTDLITDNAFMDKIEQFGADYFMFHCFLKSQMLNGGRYYIFERNIERIIKNYCLNYNAKQKNIKEIYDDLIKTKVLFVLEDSRYLDGKIIVDPYIVYNYQLTNDKRAYNRRKKEEQRNRDKAKEKDAIEVLPAPTIPLNAEKIDSSFEEPKEVPIQKVEDILSKESFLDEEISEEEFF